MNKWLLELFKPVAPRTAQELLWEQADKLRAEIEEKARSRHDEQYAKLYRLYPYNCT